MNGSETKELLYIEAEDFSLYLKGMPFNKRFESLSQYRKHSALEKEVMGFDWNGEGVLSVEVYDVETNALVEKGERAFALIFFENGVYQIVISPKTDKRLSFYHEHPGLRAAVEPVGRGSHSILMGNLQFMNEVGFTSFSVQAEGKVLLEVKLEIFPTKLGYKDDYEKLLEEVHDEVYNLAFHFIKKTFLGASNHLSENPSLAEFYRLIEFYFEHFMKSIQRIEEQPHHQLLTENQMVRGERIKRLDAKGRKHLSNNPQLFVEVENGLMVHTKSVFPLKGLNARKTITYDTLENRFVKWMMERLTHKLVDLEAKVSSQLGRYERRSDEELLLKINRMQETLKAYLNKPFWRAISRADRTVTSMVIQRKVGYRDAYKTYLVVTRGLLLGGEVFKMSVKDVATLYEYWTYLKMGQILRNKYVPQYQDVVKVRHGALFVDLDQSSKAKQVFTHPHTGEQIVLSFQKREGSTPTVTQKPDIMLEVEKRHSSNRYHYVFDAKYRIDFGFGTTEAEKVGPLEEDINTMHRYRDALVKKHHERDSYERYSFGAYVLFPWNEEQAYLEHPFYKSIDEVNIGGIPFLPNSTVLVETLVERLVESNPEDLQEEGVLPTGAWTHWESSLDQKVLVGTVRTSKDYREYKSKKYFELDASSLRKGWQESLFVALYITSDVSREIDTSNGIKFFGRVEDIEILNGKIRFIVESWQTLKKVIPPVGYGIQSHMMTTRSLLEQAEELPELFMKSGEEVKLWRMLRRLTSRVSTRLNDSDLDKAKKVLAYQIGHVEVLLNESEGQIEVVVEGKLITHISIDDLKRVPSKVFRIIKESVYR
ncbi:restriction endonuclease-like protein [Rossellomorea marisflavi]|uniref:restriction endonuclease-like protein n=1 Tax=Rossellomorea marisflavi TaxID=189381 RepID=UPI003457CD47